MADIADGAAAAAAASAANYKKMKEDFVSNLSGGSAGEVLLVTLVAPVSILAWSILQRRQSFFRPYSPIGFAVDFLLNIGAFLLATTIYSSQPLLLNALILSQAFFVLALPKNVGIHHPRKVAKKPKATTAATPLPVLPLKPFLTTYRSAMMVATCVAILAVDFRIFPRRFAKVETWGTSLMDMGVGSFVFSAGVVAARPILKERLEDGPSPSLIQRLLKSLRHSLPLLTLGVIRLLSVKGLDYAEHVTEYGVHWNFFFTLGFLPPCVVAAQSALQIVPSYAALALALAVTYELALDFTSLKAYVLTAPRVDLLSMNREGVFSCIGYLALFLAGQDTGLYLLPREKKAKDVAKEKTVKIAVPEKNSSKDATPKEADVPPSSTSSVSAILHKVFSPLDDAPSMKTLGIWSLVWFVLYQVSVGLPPYGFGLTVSRRIANLPYVLWVLHFNTIQLLCFSLVDRVVFPAFYAAKDAREEAAAYQEATSPVLRAYNRNGLAIFLVANLLTGAVNMTVPTLDVGPGVSTAILIGYAGVLTAVAVGLDQYNITIKL